MIGSHVRRFSATGHEAFILISHTGSSVSSFVQGDVRCLSVLRLPTGAIPESGTWVGAAPAATPTTEIGLTDAVHCGGVTRHRAAFSRFLQASLVWRVSASPPMASAVTDAGSSHQHQPLTESAADSAFQETQKWIEVSPNTDHSFSCCCHGVTHTHYLYLQRIHSTFFSYRFVTCWKVRKLQNRSDADFDAKRPRVASTKVHLMVLSRTK